MAVLGRDGGFFRILRRGFLAKDHLMSCGRMELEEASQITAWILEKAVWALGHAMGIFWSRI